MSLKKNIIANYLGQGWTALMGLAFVPLYIKYLGIEAYGLIGLFAVLQAWLSLLDMGMAPTLGREMAKVTGGSHTAESIRDLLRSIEIIAIVIAVIIVGGIGVGANWLAGSWLKAENLPVSVVAQAFAIMGMVTALRLLEGVYRSSIVGLQRQVLLNVVNSGMATLRGLGAVGILAWISPTIQAFFMWQCLVSLATLSLLAMTTYATLPKPKRPARFSLDAVRVVWTYAGGMMTITFLALLLTQVDKILLSKLLTLTEYGYYSLATVVASALYMLVGPVAQAFFPRMSQLHASGDHMEFVNTYHKGAQLVSVIMGSAALVVIVFAEQLLLIWVRDISIAERTAPLLRVLVLGNLMHGLLWIPHQAQLVHGWTGLAVRINTIAVLFFVPTILFVAPKYGAIGTAWVWVALNTGILLFGVHFMFRRILSAEKWSWYMKDIVKPLLAAATIALLLEWLPPKPTSLAGQLFTMALVFFLTILGATCVAGKVREQVQMAVSSFTSKIFH